MTTGASATPAPAGPNWQYGGTRSASTPVYGPVLITPHDGTLKTILIVLGVLALVPLVPIVLFSTLIVGTVMAVVVIDWLVKAALLITLFFVARWLYETYRRSTSHP